MRNRKHLLSFTVGTRIVIFLFCMFIMGYDGVSAKICDGVQDSGLSYEQFEKIDIPKEGLEEWEKGRLMRIWQEQQVSLAREQRANQTEINILTVHSERMLRYVEIGLMLLAGTIAFFTVMITSRLCQINRDANKVVEALNTLKITSNQLVKDMEEEKENISNVVTEATEATTEAIKAAIQAKEAATATKEEYKNTAIYSVKSKCCKLEKFLHYELEVDGELKGITIDLVNKIIELAFGISEEIDKKLYSRVLAFDDMNQKKWKDALMHWDDVLKHEPEDFGVLLLSAWCSYKQAEIEKEIKNKEYFLKQSSGHYDKAIDIESGYAQAWNNWAIVCEAQAQIAYDEKEKDLLLQNVKKYREKAIRLDSSIQNKVEIDES